MFSVSEYLSRIGRAHLDILDDLKLVSKGITLWLGLDGLRLNEDGTMEWVSRKKPAENVVYQTFQFVQPVRTGMILADQTKSARAQIEALANQCQVQLLWNTQMENALQQFCVQYPAQYPPYYYGGCCGNYIG